ncbi:protein Skeletor, isoforms B/C isoform X3 [Ooceraea biroi]|uniref:protein Skeletor, isoforms B/C isoform X3 n=1 Tax=Ooceraea biroi TaxID=2015173 RepID=UPI000F07E987|nr:protein Skeletor, isoforms B/C isoform X3 [Ooceraea biroi]
MTTRSLASPPMRRPSAVGLITAFLLVAAAQICSGAYYGKLLGKLSELHHGVSGEVYAVDARTLFIKDFTYDGEGPAAFFYAGNGKGPSNNNGFRVRDEHGTTNVLKRYRRKDITLTLPEGKTLNNIKWFSVWCEEFSVNFGDVKIPRGFDYPKPLKLKSLSGIHGVGSEPVVIVDAQTLLIPSFSYDGEAPDAKFWVGAGPTPSPQGIRVPDENGKEQPLRRYDRKTIVLTLPGDLTVHQLGHFGVWCEAFAVDFGHVQIPHNMNVPPSLKMLGVSPQSKLNCEVLEDSLAFEVRWAVAGDSIVVQLVAKLDNGQYMSFGLSADVDRSMMLGGDVTVAWVDKQTLQGYAIDYILDAKSQCSGRRGSCPDARIQENTDSVRLLNAALVNGYSIVTYQRSLKASDELDRPILTNRSQAIIWAIGPLNERQEVSFHSHYLKTDRFIEFSRPPAWNCPMPDQEQTSAYTDASSNQQLSVVTRRPQRNQATPAPAPTNDAWEIPPIQCYEPEDGVLYAQMGPTGGKHGYPAITGHVGWGISWYINGLLIPEINVVRGRRYTFVVEGGLDAETPARYHPFYITDDPVGGYQHKTPEEKAKVKIFAGVRRQRGKVIPTGVGRLCNWVPDQNQPPADEFASFGAYQRTLVLECDHGEPGIVEWTPDENTPDTVYYQCFTHRYLGWKINVHDSCDASEASSAASEKHEVYAEPAKSHQGAHDLEYGASIAVASKTLQTSNMVTAAGLTLPFPLPLPLPLPSQQRPIYIERKKSVYRPTAVVATTLKATSEKAASAASNNVPRDKFVKIDTKQRSTKLEAKVGADAAASDVTEGLTGPTWKVLKPARNTGFDPDSIVIEGGFKPIIRNTVDGEDFAQERISGATAAWRDEVYGKSSDYRTIDEFSPVFVPSPPVTTSTIADGGGRKRRKKTSPSRTSPRFDELDDMEMAADHRLDTYYLPPIAHTRPEQLPPASPSGVLVTYDGKKLKDSTGLARSLVDAGHRNRGRLTSDILSRTPQFGKFRGELPPPIPGEARRNGTAYGRRHRPPPVDPSRDFLPKTRLTLVERSKRSPRENRTMSSVDFQQDGDGHFEHDGHWESDRVGAVGGGGAPRGNLGCTIVLIAIAARLAI